VNKYPAAAKLYLSRLGLPITSTCRVSVAPLAEPDVVLLDVLKSKVEAWAERLRQTSNVRRQTCV
jgi:hypothetical protein